MASEKFGKYYLGECLGKGSSSTVFKCTDEFGNNLDLAIKILNKNISNTPEVIKAFNTEIKALKTIDHPNIIKIYDYGKIKNNLYIVIEIINGFLLSEVIKQYTWIPEKKALVILGQICEALKAVHREQIVHRDLNPSNIMLTKAGVIKLIDFGASKIHSDIDERLSNTLPGTLIGTIAYMSPEQLDGRPISYQSDIYSLGIIFYEMLLGKNPNRTGTPKDFLKKLFSTQNIVSSKVLSNISPEAGILLSKMLSKNTSERYKNIEQILIDLYIALKEQKNKPQTIYNFYKKNPFFEEFTNIELKLISEITKIKKFKKYERIIEEGDIGRELYFICDGELKVSKDTEFNIEKEELLAHLETNMIFGEMSFLEENLPVRTASVISESQGMLYILHYNDLMRLKNKLPDVIIKFYKATSRILINRLRLTSERLANTRLTLKNFSKLN